MLQMFHLKQFCRPEERTDLKAINIDYTDYFHLHCTVMYSCVAKSRNVST